VISGIIRDCRKSLLVVGFAAFGVAGVIAELQPCCRTRVRIDLVLESAEADGGALHGPFGASAAFKAIQQEATFWRWPAARRPVVGVSRAAMHAKLLAADANVALLSSANLTDQALGDNLELGLLVRDPEVVRRIVGHFRSLMRPGIGPLEPVTNDKATSRA
jgi:putative cardiolipin synthase